MSYLGTTRALADKTLDELESHVWLHGQDSSGITYARQTAGHELVKMAARKRVLRLFDTRAWKRGLSVLTMPGLTWTFENMLLQSRERATRLKRTRPERTYICGIEWDEAIYRVALNRIPTGSGYLRQVNAPQFATDAYQTKLISRYMRCRFEDLAEWYGQNDWSFDAAWLDFSGPLRLSRMRAVQRFWATSVRWRLVITALNGRWDEDAGEEIAAAGGISQWILTCLPGSCLIMHDHYQSGVPMLQVGVERRGVTKVTERSRELRLPVAEQSE